MPDRRKPVATYLKWLSIALIHHPGGVFHFLVSVLYIECVNLCF